MKCYKLKYKVINLNKTKIPKKINIANFLKMKT